jgi:hypothetical protein
VGDADPGADSGWIFCGWGMFVRWGVCCGCCVWKNGFIEGDVAGYNDATGGKIKAPKTFVFLWISEENAACRARLKFVVCCGIEIWKTQTTKN